MKLVLVTSSTKCNTNAVDVLSENFELIFHVDPIEGHCWVNDLDVSKNEEFLALGYYVSYTSFVVIWDVRSGLRLTQLVDPLCTSLTSVLCCVHWRNGGQTWHQVRRRPDQNLELEDKRGAEYD